MKNVRIWFTKEKECKYISHLDLNRTMLRTIRRAGLPIWYTEGFNPHPFATFPLPLALGVSGKKECMDIKIVDDDFDISLIPSMMNPYLPSGVEIISATCPKMDAKDICFAKYFAEISCETMTSTQLFELIKATLTKENLTVKKKSKAGMKDVDVLPYIKDFNFRVSDSDTIAFDVVLPAGNTKNIALALILKAIEENYYIEINYDIIKLDMYNGEMIPFE